MANIPQARKRARLAGERREHNRGQRSAMRTQIKGVVKAIRQGDAERALAAFKSAVPIIDSFATKGVIHKNKAARHKSRLNARIKAMVA